MIKESRSTAECCHYGLTDKYWMFVLRLVKDMKTCMTCIICIIDQPCGQLRGKNFPYELVSRGYDVVWDSAKKKIGFFCTGKVYNVRQLRKSFSFVPGGCKCLAAGEDISC